MARVLKKSNRKCLVQSNPVSKIIPVSRNILKKQPRFYKILKNGTDFDLKHAIPATRLHNLVYTEYSVKCAEFEILFRKTNNNTNGYIWHTYTQ